MNSFFLSLVFLICSISLQWLQADASGNETDPISLLKFKDGIVSDPKQIFTSWNESLHFCNWVGVRCGSRHRRVTSLELQGQNLVGTVSPYIGNLSFLRIINLQNNSFHGEIPREVGRLFRLQELLLNNNSLQGAIPANLSHCSQLRAIFLHRNSLSGKILTELGSLTKLEVLQLIINNLTGEIPASLGNLSSLTAFQVSFNNLVGNIPDNLGRLTSTTILAVGVNQLSGKIPFSLFNISSMTAFEVVSNKLNGSLPNNIGLTLPNLDFFGFGENDFVGSIPITLFNASKLEYIDLGWNNFVGQVPINLGNMKNLRRIRLHGNNLGSNSSDDLAFLASLINCTKLRVLDFGRNNFGGVLPSSVANLSTELNLLYFGNNQIRGTIPVGLENFIKLTGLVMHYNLFSGVIPQNFGNFQRLQVLSLSGNSLSGQIPSLLTNLTSLSELRLSRNKLEGPIPSSIGNLRNLNILTIAENNLTGAVPIELLGLPSLSRAIDLSKNSLSGKLSPEIGKLTSPTALFLSENNLSGEIPSTIGNCLGLEYLFLQENSFEGSIPSSMVSMRGLQYLDLSRNNLTGQILKYVGSMQFLLYLNLSFNDLDGEVPTEGVFKNTSLFSLIGNSKLCGGVPELNLPKCAEKVKKKGKSPAFKLAIIIPFFSLGVSLMLVFLLLYCKRKSDKISSSDSLMDQLKRSFSLSLMMNQFVLNVSYRDLYRATNGFSSNNLIGSGNFGSVYKGFLDLVQRSVAIKVLKLETKGALKSFLAECKVLMNVRHRNIVKMLTYCSSVDHQINEFKALVFEFMENGSLDTWLHPDSGSENHSRNMDLLQRINVAIDVASALHYLHDHCKRPVIHCDLKPINVLLDGDMVAHVGDFGLARLVSTPNTMSQSQLSTNGFKGTIGYAAPEYGTGSEVSKEGDAYSYGMLLLELFTGRRPTDEIFADGLNLHDFVKAALPQKVAEVADPNQFIEKIEDEGPSNIRNMSKITEQVSVSILQIGLICSAKSPKQRMRMREVVGELQLIKNALLESSTKQTDNGDF